MAAERFGRDCPSAPTIAELACARIPGSSFSKLPGARVAGDDAYDGQASDELTRSVTARVLSTATEKPRREISKNGYLRPNVSRETLSCYEFARYESGRKKTSEPDQNVAVDGPTEIVGNSLPIVRLRQQVAQILETTGAHRRPGPSIALRRGRDRRGGSLRAPFTGLSHALHRRNCGSACGLAPSESRVRHRWPAAAAIVTRPGRPHEPERARLSQSILMC